MRKKKKSVPILAFRYDVMIQYEDILGRMKRYLVFSFQGKEKGIPKTATLGIFIWNGSIVYNIHHTTYIYTYTYILYTNNFY